MTSDQDFVELLERDFRNLELYEHALTVPISKFVTWEREARRLGLPWKRIAKLRKLRLKGRLTYEAYVALTNP